MQFTDGGWREVPRHHEGARGARPDADDAARSPEPLFQHFAIVLDDEIRSWPSIDFEQYPDGISGDSAQITGLGSVEEAKDLALVLQTGALPVRFEQVDRTDISATLGEDSLRQALIAGIGGLIAVAVFLLIFYRFLGVDRDHRARDLRRAPLRRAPPLQRHADPAGLRRSDPHDRRGRGREHRHLRADQGRGARREIRPRRDRRPGYKKGFETIIDANVVTMLTAFVLFAVATAGVKGFALMLLIGTAISMFTAVAATRALLGVLSGFRWFDNPAFMGASGQTIPPLAAHRLRRQAQLLVRRVGRGRS